MSCEVVKTGWPQRVFLLVCSLFTTGVVGGPLRHDSFFYILCLLPLFIWVVTIVNWNTTAACDPEWHDYR